MAIKAPLSRAFCLFLKGVYDGDGSIVYSSDKIRQAPPANRVAPTFDIVNLTTAQEAVFDTTSAQGIGNVLPLSRGIIDSDLSLVPFSSIEAAGNLRLSTGATAFPNDPVSYTHLTLPTKA